MHQTFQAQVLLVGQIWKDYHHFAILLRSSELLGSNYTEEKLPRAAFWTSDPPNVLPRGVSSS